MATGRIARTHARRKRSELTADPAACQAGAMRRAFLVLCLATAVCGCQSKEKKFWSWFQDNSARVLEFEKDQDAVFADLGGELDKVEEGLTFEFGPKDPAGREFIVSADGIQDRFPAVQKLVSAAPSPLPGWKVLAFRPRKDIGFVIEFDGNKLGADDLWFSYEPPEEGNKLDIKLHIRELDAKNEKALTSAAFLLLDSALGEYDTETKLGDIEFAALPADPKGQNLKPLAELAPLVDRTFSK
jgi:hypothetical protein